MTIGPIMADIQGIELTQEDREVLQHPLIGGVILFARNYRDLEQLEALIQQIKAIKNPELLIAVDQEGGRVQRFKDGFSLLPPLREVGYQYDKNPTIGKKLARECGWLMAAEILSVGIDISFAPVLDLDVGVSDVIGNRAFHHEPMIVAQLAKYYINGMLEAGMKATGKHFPGHGHVAVDSHLDLPVDERHLQDIHALDMFPFIYQIGNKIDALMMAHIHFPQVAKNIISFSPYWLNDICRQQLNFGGAIFSDDLSMGGARDLFDQNLSMPERAHTALQAGCDMILICNDRISLTNTLDILQWQIDPASSLRLSLLRGDFQFTRAQLVMSERWQRVAKLVRRFIEEPMGNIDFED